MGNEVKEAEKIGFNSNYWDDVKSEYGLPSKKDINYYKNYYRFGVIDPYNEPDSGREFLFFTKPDLFICQDPGRNILSSGLASYPFFKELLSRWPNVIKELQVFDDPQPFSYLLSNMCTSNLDLPSLSAQTIQNPTNIFGISYDYRGSSEASDDNHSFSLEFKDTKNLDVYMFFRAYEEYEILKAQGVVKLYEVEHYRDYILNRILHDQIGIYKFIVAEDMETIMHYSYFCGCMFTSLPRESFNDADFHEGIKYAIDMKCAFVEDMNPLILSDFNNLVSKYNERFSEEDIASIYDFKNRKTDLLPVSSPFIVETKDADGNKRYKLRWYREDKLWKTLKTNVVTLVDDITN